MDAFFFACPFLSCSESGDFLQVLWNNFASTREDLGNCPVYTRRTRQYIYREAGDDSESNTRLLVYDLVVKKQFL